MSEFEEINFDRTLGILQGWAGRRAVVTVDNAGGPSSVAVMRGMLHPEPPAVDETGEPVDENRVDFRLDESGQLGFAIYRGSWFKGGSYHPARQELHIGVGEGGWVVLEISVLPEETS
jgi:hypothetical protein